MEENRTTDLQSPAEAGHATDPATPEATGSAGALFSSAFDLELSRRFKAAKDARQQIENEMLADLRRRDGEYEPEVLEKLEKQGGSKMFDNITDTKCSGIESMAVELLLFSGELPWGLEPTPEPEIDAKAEAEAVRAVVESAMEENRDPSDPAFQEEFDLQVDELKKRIRASIEGKAKKAAEGMQKKIADQLAEGGFQDALNDFITDIATHKFGALMGPCPKMKMIPVVSGATVNFEERLILATERVNPLNVYPASMSQKPGDGDFFIRKPISTDSAGQLRKIPGVKADRLDFALKQLGNAAGSQTLDQQLAQLAEKSTTGLTNQPDRDHELIHWWHFMSRREIADFDGTKTPDERIAGDLVPMQGLMLNGVVVKAIENLDKTGAPNVFIASYRKRSGSFYGIGGSGLAKGKQEQRNVFARALNNNANLASKPRQWSDSEMLVDPNQANEMYPGQNVAVKQNPGDTRKAIGILETPNHTGTFLAALARTGSDLDEQTGVYPQSYGSPAQTGPAETLGGYQLLRADQTKTMKRALFNISQALGGLVKAYWLWNMIFDADDSIKGDFQVVTRGPVQSFITAEDADQLLAILDLANKYPVLQSAFKPEGLAKMLRDLMKMNRINPTGILKDESEIAREAEAARKSAMAEQAAAEAPAGIQQPAELSNEPPAEKQSQIIRAEADMIRARSMAEKVELERQSKALERVERLQRIQKAQREIAAERQLRGGGLNMGAAPAMPETGMAPAMGGAA